MPSNLAVRREKGAAKAKALGKAFKTRRVWNTSNFVKKYIRGHNAEDVYKPIVVGDMVVEATLNLRCDFGSPCDPAPPCAYHEGLWSDIYGENFKEQPAFRKPEPEPSSSSDSPRECTWEKPCHSNNPCTKCVEKFVATYGEDWRKVLCKS